MSKSKSTRPKALMTIYEKNVKKKAVIIETFRHKQDLILPELVIEGIYKALQEHGEIYIERIGKLSITTLPKRKSFNPMSGKAVTLPPVNKAQFRAGEELKRKINE